MNIPDSDLDQWLAELKPYQQTQLKKLVEKHGEEEAAKIWITANGPNETRKFGGEPSESPFYDKFKKEFKKFVCGHDDYDKDREKLKDESPVVKNLMITTVSTAIGAQLGIAATLLAPTVVIFLHIVGKVGLNAWCSE